mmetsp:Transcript_32741/g.63896  ORF Transcript_32741/g.63896 Transcript_32741/m.63896 type:complete len:89 (+) Transcript_32741:57-323(+)
MSDRQVANPKKITTGRNYRGRHVRTPWYLTANAGHIRDEDELMFDDLFVSLEGNDVSMVTEDYLRKSDTAESIDKNHGSEAVASSKDG